MNALLLQSLCLPWLHEVGQAGCHLLRNANMPVNLFSSVFNWINIKQAIGSGSVSLHHFSPRRRKSAQFFK